jgi:hypothetical protein
MEERWTSQLITFFWTQGHTLWKDMCASTNAPAAVSLIKSSARTRQETAQNRMMTMAYASSPLTLAIDRRIFDIPLDERLQGRTSDLVAWTKTMLPAIRLSISAAQNQLRTGHQDIRTYFSDTVAPERNMNATVATATATVATTTTDRIGPRRTDFRQRPQQPRILPATTSTNIRRSRHHYIGDDNHTHDVRSQGRTDHSHTQYLLLIRNILQPPRTQVTQATTEEDPTTSTVNNPSLDYAPSATNRSQETQAPTEDPTTSTVSTFSRLRALRNRFQQARTQPNSISIDTWRFLPSYIGATVPVKSNGVNGVSLTN